MNEGVSDQDTYCKMRLDLDDEARAIIAAYASSVCRRKGWEKDIACILDIRPSEVRSYLKPRAGRDCRGCCDPDCENSSGLSIRDCIPRQKCLRIKRFGADPRKELQRRKKLLTSKLSELFVAEQVMPWS